MLDFNKEELQLLDSAYLGEFKDGDHVVFEEVGGLYMNKFVWTRYRFFFDAFSYKNYIERITKEFNVSRNTARKWIKGDIILQLIQRYCDGMNAKIRETEREIERAKKGKRYKYEAVPDLERARMKRLNKQNKNVRKLY